MNKKKWNLGVWEHDGGVKQGGGANPGRNGELRGASPSCRRSQGACRPKQRWFNTLRIETALGRPPLCNALAGPHRGRRWWTRRWSQGLAILVLHSLAWVKLWLQEFHGGSFGFRNENSEFEWVSENLRGQFGVVLRETHRASVYRCVRCGSNGAIV